MRLMEMMISSITMLLSLLLAQVRCRPLMANSRHASFILHNKTNKSKMLFEKHDFRITSLHQFAGPKRFIKTLIHANKDSTAASLGESTTPFHDHLYEAWTLEQDQFLYDNRKESIPKLASFLGRGLKGVESRLQKLSDVNSGAYARLFIDTKDTNRSSQIDSKQKSSLVPAIEVLRRVRWDTSLSPGDFSVLHYDRVDDTIYESNFNDPNTSIKGKEELFVFAIPEHRIAAVKYKERVVWDREKRLDCVFGSMNGNGERIEMVLETYDEWKRKKDEEEELNRMRQIDVSRRLIFVLGEERFTALKEKSSFLMGVENVDYEIQSSTKKYVKFSLDLFKSACAENQNSQRPYEDMGKKERLKQDLDFMYLFSELVALLPKEEVREFVLAEIEIVIERLEGKENKKQNRGILPELREEDLEEKFVKGSGAGGQKVS